jgi:hypothetical protein
MTLSTGLGGNENSGGWPSSNGWNGSNAQNGDAMMNGSNGPCWILLKNLTPQVSRLLIELFSSSLMLR